MAPWGVLGGWLRRGFSLAVTTAAFCMALFLLPALLLMYSVISRVRAAWLGVLERRYPQLEFVRNTTVRTAVDTHRNQGVIALLLTVQGECNPYHIKARLQEDILDRRADSSGRLRFPHLRTPLTQRWGRYAWKRDASVAFQLDKQLVVCSAAFRGRPVADHNIQEVVSDLVSKYLAPELPPWQVAIIPSTDRYFVLIRMHHLLLSEDGLKLTDLLQLTRTRTALRALQTHPHDVSDSKVQFVHADSEPKPEVEDAVGAPRGPSRLLDGMLQPPVAIPALYERLGESVANHWNELIAVYDPLENPKALKYPTLVGLSAALLISLVSAVPDALLSARVKGSGSGSGSYWEAGALGLAWGCVRAQAERRGVTRAAWRAALSAALAPPTLVLSAALLTYRAWRGAAGLALRMLLVAALEAASIAKHRGRYAESLMLRSPYLQLWWSSLAEAWRLCRIVFNAPRLLVEDLFLSNRQQPPHHFQTVSLCGRKVVAWSEPFLLERIQQIADAIGATTSEVCLSALCGALREYFRSHGLPVPENVLTTARFCPLEELVGGPAEGGYSYSSGGMACLALPVADAGKNPVHLVQEVRERMRVVRERQPALWLVSSWQLERGLLTRLLPQLLVRLHLNYLSRRYSVALNEVSPQRPDYPTGLVWGQPLTSLMYWRPPQANVSLSLTLLTLDNVVSLGVMSDAQLSPQQGVIARTWTQHLRDLARAAGVPLPSPRSLSPSPAPALSLSPSPSPPLSPSSTDSAPPLALPLPPSLPLVPPLEEDTAPAEA